MDGARPGGRRRPRDTCRDRTGSSALAPAAHGGLPPERYPGTARHRSAAVTPAERAQHRNGHPPGALVLNRARPPARAAPLAPSHVMPFGHP